MHKIPLILTIVGGLNWGLVALFRFDLVAWLFGSSAALGSRIIYGLIGLSALWCVTLLFHREEPHHHHA
ncbi:MAG: DUF378 domain-containing protein [Clostridia bacterium]|nr:DUF378 domain-containing protein [Clostridia bacterium]MBQ6710729.1 DUF378 domain-containing protein [Clostridia bacterium]MBR6573471.1 DUF378 domain-containing protein [Clostridia bacterium]